MGPSCAMDCAAVDTGRSRTVKGRINRWMFGYKGLIPEYQKGERWLVVVGTVMLLAGLGLAGYWAVVVILGGDAEWRHLAACLVLGLGGGLATFALILNAMARELKKRREESPIGH